MNVAVRDLKNGLSEYLRRVKAGERLIVTERGRPVAEVSPIGSAGLTPEQRLDRLVEAGEVRRGRGGPLSDAPAVRVRGRAVSETLLEDRG